jgi:hypothetical protein
MQSKEGAGPAAHRYRAASAKWPQWVKKAKYSLRADVFRFTPNNGHAVTAPP